MDYPKLKEELENRALLKDEIAMWLRLGFYVTSDPRRVLSQDRTAYIMVVTIIDGMVNKEDIDAIMGRNLRSSVLTWWQVERVKPRAKEVVDNTGLGDLENRQNA